MRLKHLFIFLGICLTGCTPSAIVSFSSDYNTHPIGRIALINILDYPEAPGSGEIAASTFETYLLSAGYKLVERRQVSKILKEQSFDFSGSVDLSTIKNLGKILGVDALVFGTLTNFSDPREHTVMVNIPQQQSEPIFGQVVTVQHNKDTTVKNVQNVITGYSYSQINQLVPQTEITPAKVGMSIRLVDVETGEILWSASASSPGADLSAATEQASNNLIKSVIKQRKKSGGSF